MSGSRTRVRAGHLMAPWLRRTVLLVLGAYFLLPVLAAAEFSARDAGGTHSLAAYRAILRDPGLVAGLRTSLSVAAGTIGLTLLLVVPTAFWVHLRLPRLRLVVEGLAVLPLVIPPVVLVVGVLSASRPLPDPVKGTPVILALEYVVLALPFTYRAVDAGLAAIDLRTLVEAARSCGASWPTTLARVVVPNIRAAVLGAAFLTLALVLGEFTMASLMLFNTLPTWIVQVGQSSGGASVGVSVLALVTTWALLFVLSVAGSRREGSRRAGPAAPPPPDGATPEPLREYAA